MRLTKSYLAMTVCTLTILLGAGYSHGGSANFDQSLTHGEISFRVASTNQSSLNTLTITPSGLTISNRPETLEIDGTITGASVGDLDHNGWPEIYVFITSAGSGSYGSMAGFAVNNGKSMSAIYLPPVHENPNLSDGYMGHDQFELDGDRLVQRFPLYREGDTQSQATGGVRQIGYQLKAGEAGWSLQPDRVEEIPAPTTN